MTTPHPYRLRAYHNPENVDESKVPAGWRFRYVHEMQNFAISRCRLWLPISGIFGMMENCSGVCHSWTYIVPVAP